MPVQVDLGSFTCQVLQRSVMSWLPKQTSWGVQPYFKSPLSVAGRKKGNL